jgi:hypothetical protein
MKQLLADQKTKLPEHSVPPPPYLAACNFHLLRKAKSALEGTHFQTVREAKSKTSGLLKWMSADDRKHRFEQCKIRMQRGRDMGVGMPLKGK